MDSDAYRKIIDYLHRTNVGEFVELPQIVVVGDTSSGKSSILSALAHIQFPVNDEITTRCPIRLKIEQKQNPQTLATISITWHSTTANKPHWENVTINCADDIPKYIEEAQCLILAANPEKQIASDIIELHIAGLNLSDLTIIDLPGIVQATGIAETDSLISEVSALITAFIRQERSVIVVVQPANVDFHNSKALALAQSADPDRKRTIPVITKPDLIDPGGETQVVELLLGNKTAPYPFGFHVVKCRGKAAMIKGVTAQESEADENHFFKSISPWKNIDQSFCGITNLRGKLSEILINIIESATANIIHDIAKKLEDTNKELAKLGPNPDIEVNKREIWNNVLHHLMYNIKGEIDGSAITPKANTNGHSSNGHGAIWSLEPTWCAKSHASYKAFACKVLDTTLATIANTSIGSQVTVHFDNGEIGEGEIIKIWAGGDMAFVKPLSTSDHRFYSAKGKKQIITVSTESKVPQEGEIHEDEDGFCYVIRQVKHSQTAFASSKPSKLDSSVLMPPPSAKTVESKCHAKEYHCTVDMLAAFKVTDINKSSTWLQPLIQQFQTHSLPCFPNVSIFNFIIAHYLDEEWKPLAMKLCSEIYILMGEVCHKQINRCIPDNFSRLKTMLFTLMDKLIRDRKQTTEVEIRRILSYETRPFTLNQQTIEQMAANKVSSLKKRVRNSVSNLFMNDGKGDERITHITSVAQHAKQSKVDMNIDGESLMSLFHTAVLDSVENAFNGHSSQPMDTMLADEMQVMLSVYGGIAAKRIIDCIPMLLTSNCTDLLTSIQLALSEKKFEDIQELICEDEFTRSKRQRLLSSSESLSQACLASQNILCAHKS